jgi:hypothetical protein
MHFEIPEGAPVYIFVGKSRLDEIHPAVPYPLHTSPEIRSESRWGWGLAKGLIVLAMLAGAFQGGRYVSHPSGLFEGTRTAALPPLLPPSAWPPDQTPLTPDGPTAESPLPSAFLEQMNEPPRVTPPPSAPTPPKPIAIPAPKTTEIPTRTPKPNPFGLHE